MSEVVTVMWDAVRDSFLMAWEVWWALVLGFAIVGGGGEPSSGARQHASAANQEDAR
jgi:hypothetical protein